MFSLVTHIQEPVFTRTVLSVTGLLFVWGVIWTIAYFYLPNAQGHLAYGLAPVMSGMYWFVCAGIVLTTFWRSVRRVQIAHSVLTYGAIFVFAGALFYLYAYIFPELGARASSGISGIIAFGDKGFAYMLPKAVEIAFQQVFILALVSVLAEFKNDIRFVSFCYALVFGAAHLPLLFVLSAHAALLIVFFAAASAIVFPYLMLRVTNGFVYAYIAHWLFYIILLLSQYS